MNWLELAAALTGILGVWFEVKRNIWTFPVGIVMVSLYFIVFYEQKLYSDMILQVVYIVMQIQGWYVWARSDRAADQKIMIGKLNRRRRLYSLLVLGAGTFALGYCMHRFTDANLPWVDAFTTVLSLIAQWWMNYRYLDSWIFWIVVDAIYLYQYTVKELYFTVVLSLIFIVLAFMGYSEWKRKLLSPPASSAPGTQKVS